MLTPEEIINIILNHKLILDTLERAMEGKIRGRLSHLETVEGHVRVHWDDGLMKRARCFKAELVAELVRDHLSEEVARAERYETYLRLKEEFGE